MSVYSFFASGLGQSKNKFTAAPVFAFDPDFSLMAFNDFFANGQS
jgi:hypothetical protein